MKIKAFLMLLILICITAVLISCGPEIVSSYLNDKNEIIGVYADGTEKVLGQAVSIVSTKVDENFHVIIEYSDGSTKDIGYVGVVDESLNVTVVDTRVNEEMHLIVTYSNGRTEDLGYVGVEVEPPMYTVTFIDYYGNVLSVQEVYRGKSAKAPAAPAVTDKVFAGWNVDFTNVQSNLTVKAVYDNAAEYTVIFKDADGAEIKTQVVISGHAATAPNVSNKENEIFTGWDKSFTSINSDMVITAQYRAKYNYTVTFKDYTGLVLGTKTVKEGDTVQAPVTPTREGYSFAGWSSSLSNITSDKTVTAKYTLNAGKNIFDISYMINANNTLTVTFAVKGTIGFCGLEGRVELPAGITFDSMLHGEGAMANHSNGVVYFTFTTPSATNTNKDTTIMTLTLRYDSSVTTTVLNTVVADIYDQDFNTVEYVIIGGEIKVTS